MLLHSPRCIEARELIRQAMGCNPQVFLWLICCKKESRTAMENVGWERTRDPKSAICTRQFTIVCSGAAASPLWVSPAHPSSALRPLSHRGWTEADDPSPAASSASNASISDRGIVPLEHISKVCLFICGRAQAISSSWSRTKRAHFRFKSAAACKRWASLLNYSKKCGWTDVGCDLWPVHQMAQEAAIRVQSEW